MFQTLFRYPRVLARHASGPLGEERRRYLEHRANQGTPRSTLLRYARELLVVSSHLKLRLGQHVRPWQIQQAGRRWAQRQRRRRRATGPHGSEALFVQTAMVWLRFLGRLKAKPPRPPAHALRLQRWAAGLADQDGLSPRTIAKYQWWARQFGSHLARQSVRLHDLTLTQVDAFLGHLGQRGLSRASITTAARSLRRFFQYAYQQGWCRNDLAAGVLAPRLFRHEDLPQGPSWTDVQRLLAATDTDRPGDVRNRAVLWLFAVYGLRSGEVAHLCLGDLDWEHHLLRVRRSKSSRLQEYPLTTATRQLLRRYVKEARPASQQPELFLTRTAPFRPLSQGALYDLVQRLLEQLEIPSRQRGPHALRHACATYLLHCGLSLKQVGDHLGHRDLGSTQIYAKVDLAALRQIAKLNLRGVV